MNIFNPYLDVIKKAVNQDPKNQQKIYGGEIDDSQFDTAYIQSLRQNFPSQAVNESILLKKGFTSPSLNELPAVGCHPDFQHLRFSTDSEDHWIITGFIDVKESTKLFNRFTKATVSLITEGILKASIYTVNLCGGYVQRIQGDGLMVYFGGKEADKKEATESALKAFAMISYFVKNDLKAYFEESNITEIYTRAGIDLGHNNQVRWIYSGLGNTGEVTTCSLHTSLAPKMQSQAKNNGIVVGQNVVNQLPGSSYFEIKSKPIWDYGDGRFYNQYDFKWEFFLLKKGIAVQDRFGTVVLALTFDSPHLPAKNNLGPIASKNKPYCGFHE